MERYEAYKDSGVEWIGEIPERWETRRVKSDYSVIAGATPSSGVEEYWNGDIPWITPADYSDYQHYVRCGSRFISREGLNSCGTTLVPAGSVILSNRAPIGLVAVAESSLCTNQGCKALVACNDAVFPEYLYWFLTTQSEVLNSLGRGTTFLELSSSSLEEFTVPAPPLCEQLIIADYLDVKTAEIDVLVADCEREAELLREYRKSLISEAVTKGLDPDAPMKDSGVEWIGEIPEGWEIQAVRRFSNIVRGASPRPAGDPLLFDGDFMPWITVAEVTNCTGKYIYSTSSYLTELGSHQSRIIDPGTLLMSNSGATLGVPRISCIRGCINDGSVAFLNVSVDLEFLYYALSSMTDRLREMVKYGGQPNLNTDIVKSINIAIPPLEEQHRITIHLDSKTAEIDSLIEAKQSMADRLREYRKSLISEAVTGKFKVPGVN